MVLQRCHALEGVLSSLGMEHGWQAIDNQIGTGTWFPPAVNIYRSPSEPSVTEHPAMREGDLLHVDIGITAMGMNTDTQHLAYILRSNETEAPSDLVRGLHNSNRMQDLNRKEMVPGRTGDDVFFRIKDDMRSVGLDGDIYSHPIGDYGHSAGAVIGMANWQDGQYQPSPPRESAEWRRSYSGGWPEQGA